jgi:hypothetical protein
MATQLFGTDGIRGKANEYPITPEIALRIGQAISRVLRSSGANHNRVIIGKDTRLSGYMLEAALTAGFVSAGIDVVLVGPLPTPAIALLARSMRAFRDAMQAIGMWDNVCAFTASDFNRTFNPNKSDSTGGSDHAWGGHSLIMGGAVKGKQIYGRFPSLIKGGPTTNVPAQYLDCSGSSGRWIPSTSVDQYAATIGKWFGVSDANLSTVFPNLGRFMPNGIGESELVAKNLDIFDYSV